MRTAARQVKVAPPAQSGTEYASELIDKLISADDSNSRNRATWLLGIFTAIDCDYRVLEAALEKVADALVH